MLADNICTLMCIHDDDGCARMGMLFRKVLFVSMILCNKPFFVAIIYQLSKMQAHT